MPQKERASTDPEKHSTSLWSHRLRATASDDKQVSMRPRRTQGSQSGTGLQDTSRVPLSPRHLLLRAVMMPGVTLWVESSDAKNGLSGGLGQ